MNCSEERLAVHGFWFNLPQLRAITISKHVLLIPTVGLKGARMYESETGR